MNGFPGLYTLQVRGDKERETGHKVLSPRELVLMPAGGNACLIKSRSTSDNFQRCNYKAASPHPSCALKGSTLVALAIKLEARTGAAVLARLDTPP